MDYSVTEEAEQVKLITPVGCHIMHKLDWMDELIEQIKVLNNTLSKVWKMVDTIKSQGK